MMMEDITMRGVAPMRWKEMRKRVATLQRYGALGRPTAKDREDAADELGLSVNQFKRLVRSWRLHKKPALLNGAGAPEKTRSHRSDGLAQDVLDIIGNAIRLHGPSEVPAVITNTVWTECDRKSLDRPSNSTIWKAVGEARRFQRCVPGADQEIIIGRAWADLPIQNGDDTSTMFRPELLIALELPERRIIDWNSDLRLGRPPLLTDLGDLRPDDRPITITRDDAGDPNKRTHHDDIVISDDANARFIRMIGPTIDTIGLTFRMPRIDASRLLTSQLDEPLDKEDAMTAIEYAVTAHNRFVERADQT
ncbi:MAG: hypothetical protein GW854_07070 [Erythrobacter sp.]|nr:hypothetical protein [Erythrobacter sp.]